MGAEKKRLDVLACECGLFPSRKEAQTAIMDGWVLVNGEKTIKPGTSVNINDLITLKKGFKKKKYVSRGGLKLEAALEQFNIDVTDQVCLDIGASTGGFTDCMLKRGATIVYAVDVGYGQLDWSLRSDNRVITKERINARYLTPDILYEEDSPRATFASIDCSFISLEKIIPVLALNLAAKNSGTVCLVKPQFEAGYAKVKKGIVKDPAVHVEVLENVLSFANKNDLNLTKATYSPIKGPKGNIEYLVHLENSGENLNSFQVIVKEASDALASSS